MTKLGLIDQYHLHLRPFVLGQGKPFFHGARPPLRLLSSELVDDDTVHLAYEPANDQWRTFAQRPSRPLSAGRLLAGVDRQLSGEGPLVGGPRFAAGHIGGEVRIFVQQTRRFQPEQH